MTQVKLHKGLKRKWPDYKCTDCKYFLDILNCQHCIRYQGRKDKWVASSAEAAYRGRKSLAKRLVEKEMNDSIKDARAGRVTKHESTESWFKEIDKQEAQK